MSDDLSGFSMMDLFRMEAEERLAVLSQGLVALEGTGATAGAIEPLMRAAHSLKGAARVVGLDAAVRVAHAMEDCLVAAQRGQVALGPGGIDALLRGVDLLTQVSGVSEGEIGAWEQSHAGEVEALAADLAAVQAGGEPPSLAAPVPASAPQSVEEEATPPVPPPPMTEPPSAAPPPKVPSGSPPRDDLSGFSMMDLFRMEAEERLAVLSQGLVALEGTGATAGAIEPLMRAAHSLKGAARVVGLDAAVRVAHAMEDCLVAAQRGQAALGPGGIDALLRGVDLLTQVSGVSEGEIGAWEQSHAGEVEALAAGLAAVQAGSDRGAASHPVVRRRFVAKPG